MKAKIKNNKLLNKTTLILFTLLFAGIGTYLIVGSRAATDNSCTVTLNPGANVSSALTSVASGGTVCLTEGTYPGWSQSIVKSSMTTVKSISGSNPSLVKVGPIGLSQSSNLTLKDFTVGPIDTSSTSPNATNITLSNLTFTQTSTGVALLIYATSNANHNFIVENSDFANLSVSGSFEGRITVFGSNGNETKSNGVIIKGNKIGPGGCADGIQIIREARGTQILNNEFVGIKQGSCAPVHADPIQPYGANNTLIDGNYFHGNSTGIMDPDCNGSPITITNNVFHTDGEYPDQVLLSGGDGDIVSNNTFANGARFRSGSNNPSCPNGGGEKNIILTNNVLTGGISQPYGTMTGTIDYNLSTNSFARGLNGVNGTPIFVGGTNPTTYEAFKLAEGSPGSVGHPDGAGSDGNDIGINVLGSTPPPTTLQGDVNKDSKVDIIDLSTLLGKWNTYYAPADFKVDSNNTIDIFDLSILLSNWGKTSTTTPPPPPAATCTGAQHTPGGPDGMGGCWPGPDNTGPNAPESTMPAYTGSCTINTPNVTIDSKVINCSPVIVGSLAYGLVIKNSYIKGGVIQSSGSASFTIQDSLLDNAVNYPSCASNGGEMTSCPAGKYACGDPKNATTVCGVGYKNYTILRTEIINSNRAAYCESTCTIQDSYFHGTNLWPDETNLAHASSVRNEQFLTLRHNALGCDFTGPFPSHDELGCSADMSGYPDFAPIKNATIDKNLFLSNNIGAGFCVYGGGTSEKTFSDDPTNATYIKFTDNIFQRGANGKCGTWGPVTDFIQGGTGNVWTNNKFDNGTIVNPA